MHNWSVGLGTWSAEGGIMVLVACCTHQDTHRWTRLGNECGKPILIGIGCSESPVALEGLAQQRLGLLGMSPFPQDARKVLAGVRNVWQEGFGIVCRQKTHSDELLADEGFGVTQKTLI